MNREIMTGAQVGWLTNRLSHPVPLHFFFFSGARILLHNSQLSSSKTLWETPDRNCLGKAIFHQSIPPLLRFLPPVSTLIDTIQSLVLTTSQPHPGLPYAFKSQQVLCILSISLTIVPYSLHWQPFRSSCSQLWMLTASTFSIIGPLLTDIPSPFRLRSD